jgi:hypothetical protein
MRHFNTLYTTHAEFEKGVTRTGLLAFSDLIKYQISMIVNGTEWKECSNLDF